MSTVRLIAIGVAVGIVLISVLTFVILLATKTITFNKKSSHTNNTQNTTNPQFQLEETRIWSIPQNTTYQMNDWMKLRAIHSVETNLSTVYSRLNVQMTIKCLQRDTDGSDYSYKFLVGNGVGWIPHDFEFQLPATNTSKVVQFTMLRNNAPLLFGGRTIYCTIIPNNRSRSTRKMKIQDIMVTLV